MPVLKHRHLGLLAFTLSLVYLYCFWGPSGYPSYRDSRVVQDWQTPEDSQYFWKAIPTHFPPRAISPLPNGRAIRYPKVQAAPRSESAAARQVRKQHQLAVRDTFVKCWNSYKQHAWKADELAPVSGGKHDPFGGWAATLVDSLDTLWIMDLESEFLEAVEAATSIDFTHTELSEVNVFETTIRYLGGFLSAYDLSHDVRLLRKAVQVGEMLYKACDTPNRMPITRWDIHAAVRGEKQSASSSLVAEIGSLSMEFTRLSQLTGDAKWYDAIKRITDVLADQQSSTELPGLWPLVVNTKDQIFNDGSLFTLGAMADSVYEYLPKMSALMGGQETVYQTMYEKAIDAAIKHTIFRPMLPNNDDILMSGIAHTSDNAVTLQPQGQHLVCFLGGLLALGGKLFSRKQDLHVAEKLVDGCTWTYRAFPRHIMPETFSMVPCPSHEPCEWNATLWKSHVSDKKPHETADNTIAKERLPAGFSEISDRRYILRPEAIESVFVLYRVTRRQDLLESAWDMFTSINSTTNTALANSAVWDVTVDEHDNPGMADSMESFWLGETLKYFYLMFSEESLVSLDEWVFNTEAHPFRRTVA
ncbi:hypothetical protein QQS21_008676 [Conoideocrella luteorostrata]|uniref:alpha-1,2-Mannosidase n=1 Tax=Conoideocrella luteorostrata TaxID=1105319 RepID=A0AAJ0CKS7_9HYPO|nr:hypothetical protein QQS21_008676 [Conoideocrella luteorostrata]